jgi:predicted dehydrogenase
VEGSPFVNPVTRRRFLGSAAVGTAALAHSKSFAATLTQPRRVKIGLIGTGWWGLVVAKAGFAVQGIEVVAICDVDSAHLEKAAAEIEGVQGMKPRTFKNYEDLLAVDGLEAVIIGTPTQWHALQFIAAVNRGLDVYCEKPLAADIREGRAMVQAAERSGRIVQVGFQRRQSDAYKQVRDFLNAGTFGRVVQAEAQINFTAGLKDPAPVPPPATLDWDAWCGPAPLLPYSEQIGHMSWRLEKTTGQGHLYDWGIHLIDSTRLVLGETVPHTITAAGGIFQHKGRITTPDTLNVTFEFTRCPVTWRHRLWGAQEYTPEINNGIMFFCEQGSVFAADNRWIEIPAKKDAQRVVHQVQGNMSNLHMAEFLESVRTRKPAGTSVAEAHMTTSTVKLAMIAYETGGRLRWDAAKEDFIGNPAASKLLQHEYRAGYKHPASA